MLSVLLIVCIPLAAILIFVSLFSFARALILRISFYRKLSIFAQNNKFKLKKTRNILASFFCFSSKPDLILKVADKEYLIRFVTCMNQNLFYNFPTDEYYIRFERVLSLPFNPTGRFRYLPPLKEEFLGKNEKKVFVLLFAPSLAKVSYLNNEKTQRKWTGNTKEIGNWLVYKEMAFLDFLQAELK